MAYAHDLILSAEKLLAGAPDNVRTSDCNRAVSTAYYVLFDHLCRLVAGRVVPSSSTPSEMRRPWVDVYRSIDHGKAQTLLSKLLRMPAGTESDHVLNFASAFIGLQNARKEADYLPTKAFSRTEAEFLINQAKSAIHHLDSLSFDEVSDIVGGLVAKQQGR